jgi:heme-degrading monooxygenase HmoA
MIARIWHGYTTKANADIYENLLKEEVFVGIEKKNVSGYKGIQLLKRELENETEFTTIMWFENLESVKQFAGDDYETAYVPAKAREVLKRFDEKSIHCELRQDNKYN